MLTIDALCAKIMCIDILHTKYFKIRMIGGYYLVAKFETNGINIFYEDLGDKESEHCAVFFNGAMSTTSSWELLYPLFLRMGWRVVLHDYKGQLMSDKPAGPYTFKEHADEAKALFEYIGLKQVHVIGTSYGGRVAMEFALLYPEAVLSMSIISSLSESDVYIDTLIAGWIKTCVVGNGENFFWSIVPTFYGKTFIKENQEELKKRGLALGGVNDEFFVGQKAIYDTLSTDIYATDRLHAINCPTLVAVGDEDLVTPVKLSEILVQNIPNTEFVMIPDCGHVAIAEKPNELESVVFGFALKHGFKTLSGGFEVNA